MLIGGRASRPRSLRGQQTVAGPLSVVEAVELPASHVTPFGVALYWYESPLVVATPQKPPPTGLPAVAVAPVPAQGQAQGPGEGPRPTTTASSPTPHPTYRPPSPQPQHQNPPTPGSKLYSRF